MRRPGAVLVAAATAVTMTAGCGVTSVRDVPLPGGVDLGDHPYTVIADFEHVLDLVPQAAVRSGDVAVGRVSSVTLPPGQWNAQVIMQINGNVRLPANALAHLETSSLLGEKYIQLAAPTRPSGQLKNGDHLGLDRTDRNAEVEEVLGALSMLLNGGGLAQIRTINRELSKALGGNEAKIRDLLGKLSTFAGTLNKNKATILAAIDALDRLAATLKGRRKQITAALDGLTPGLKVLHEQRSQLVTMLVQLTRLSSVAQKVVNASKDDAVADLRALEPTLRKLSDAGTDLPRSLEVLLTYPFTDEVQNAVKGDYLNAFLSMTAAADVKPLIPTIEIIPDPVDVWPNLPFEMVDQDKLKVKKRSTPSPTACPTTPSPTPDDGDKAVQPGAAVAPSASSTGCPTPTKKPAKSPSPTPSKTRTATPTPTPTPTPSDEPTGEPTPTATSQPSPSGEQPQPSPSAEGG